MIMNIIQLKKKKKKKKKRTPELIFMMTLIQYSMVQKKVRMMMTKVLTKNKILTKKRKKISLKR